MRLRLVTWLAMLLATGPVAGQVVEIRQGTNLSLAIAPAGDVLVVDLLGGLWRLPVTGGGAQALIPAGSGIAQPRFSPDGRRIVVQRWLDGQWDIWQLTLADGEFLPLTQTGFNEREPDYAPDGREIVFASDRGGDYEIWALDPAADSLRQLTDEPGTSRFPTYSENGELAYVHRQGLRSSIRLFAGGRGDRALVMSERTLDAPSFRPGGGVLVFNRRIDGVSSNLAFYIDADEPVERRLTDAEDVFVGRVGWLSPSEYVYAADGQLWRRGIASRERTPIHLFAGATIDAVSAPVVTRALDAPGPHAVAGINGAVRHEGSGRWAFTALGDLWLVDDDDVRRLTDDAATDAWPDFGADGDSIVFASDRDGRMRIWRLGIDDGELQPVTSGPGRAFLPRVSADGRYLAWLETAGLGEWDAAALRLAALDRSFGPETLATGLFDAGELTWSGSRVRLLARDLPGRDRVARTFGTPAQATGMSPQTNRPVLALPATDALRWRPAASDAAYVIQAGRIFDGFGSTYRYLVDIHVEGQRITAIVARGRLPLPERVIDADDLTVLPGLIDVHAHHSAIAGSEPGRLWLRHGVTTVRDAMADATVAIERAETWDSGRQPGPRLVVSPAAATTAPVAIDSPIVIGGGAVAASLTHDLAEQAGRGDLPAPGLPPILVPGSNGNGPTIAVSTLGRSYQDVFGPLTASGAWLPTGLAALSAAEPLADLSASVTTIERVMRSSGRVAIGSDAPAVGYGSGFHAELELLAEQGIPNDQILRWATAGGALALGLSAQLGTLEPGRLADLVVVDGDPLDDISELARIEAVVRGGVWMPIDALIGPD